MKRVWIVLLLSLLLTTFSSQCSTMDAPEATAKNNFSEWAVHIRIPYKNEQFQTIANDDTFATVLITVDLKVNGEWTEKQIEVHCEKVDADWECDRSMQLK